MERIICIANQKGGVGKTTTVVNLAASLVHLGHRVAVIDLDPQGALTVSLGLDPYKIRPSSYNLLLDPNIKMDDMQHRVKPNLFLIPANAELIAAEYHLIHQKDRTDRLRAAIQRSHTRFEYILIDTPPSLSLLTVNGIAAAHELLIPVAANYLAMRGVRSLLDSVWLIRERINPTLKLHGVLPTLVNVGAPNAQAAISEMKMVFKHKVFRTFIPYDEVAAMAPAARQAAVDYQPQSPVSLAYQQLAKEVSYANG